MPYRKNPLVTGQYYHIFNRGIDSRPIFLNKRDYQRFFNTLVYYQVKLPLKLSTYLALSSEDKQKWINQRKLIKPYVEIACYCLMPNHFHLLLKQTQSQGISTYLRHVIDSFTRYFNTRTNRLGALLQGRFKSVLVETDDQLLHLSRYIHLNPLTSFIVKDFTALRSYTWSSLLEFINGMENVCNKEIVLDAFKNKSAYEVFLKNQADYQHSLELIKHLTYE